MADCSEKRTGVARQLALPTVMTVSMVLIWLWGKPAAEALMFQRDSILSGQVWRLLAGHGVHLGWQHLMLNLIGLVVIWWLFGRQFEGERGWLLTGSIAIGMPLALLLFHPNIEWYAGFSGVLHGLVVAGALLSRSENPVVSWLILIGITGKLVMETVRGGNPHLAALINGPILIHAHVYGAMLGGLSAWAITAGRSASGRG